MSKALAEGGVEAYAWDRMSGKGADICQKERKQIILTTVITYKCFTIAIWKGDVNILINFDIVNISESIRLTFLAF